MSIDRLDHVNIRTAHLEAMIAWYRDVLGFEQGKRPPFAFGGAWMYSGGDPTVHLVEVAEQPAAREPAIEHAAFRGADLAGFLDRLKGKDVPFTSVIVPGFEIIQINVHDPDGNHLHIDFAPTERAALDALG